MSEETTLKSTWGVRGFPFWAVWVSILTLSLVEFGASLAGYIDTPLYVRAMIDGSLATLIIIYMVDLTWGRYQ